MSTEIEFLNGIKVEVLDTLAELVEQANKSVLIHVNLKPVYGTGEAARVIYVNATQILRLTPSIELSGGGR
ncbi:MAG: hypothetical protein HY329_01220 [Chloroflexi bacterium]|nr:hypothetical protein [Chloroflexota bacterium]